MWEFLTQLRLSLPYLARQAPRLDRSLAKPSPEFGDLSQAISQIQTGVRDLEVQARNQALQMERIEQQIAGWRVVQQANLEQNLELIAEVGSLRRWVIAVGIAILVLLLAGGGMMLFLGVAGGKD